ncbi:BrnT family toxin [Gilvimarinus xylanilyticus]|uniref:BrnT family toxin n=1 Tax=Gilvimarinus xylanilyticus TaxID=2944139 RepID=A0A9X2HXI2_9GAMM|nr:BrnT family toxin [Gilvimarinus xylanilyticus]
MKVEYDEAKNQRNIQARGLSFELVANFDFEGALEVVQTVEGERRYFALCVIGHRLHALVYTLRADAVRVISLRKANQREVRRYEQVN